MTEINEKTKELLFKLKALAEQGVGGEKDNALRMLQKTLDKFGLRLEDLDTEERPERHSFKVTKHKILFSQIVFQVLNVDRFSYHKEASVIEIDCTHSQAIEIELKYEVYGKALDEELECLRQAFYCKHRLFSKVEKDESEPAKESSPEEFRKAMKAFSMMASLDNVAIRKQLEK